MRRRDVYEMVEIEIQSVSPQNIILEITSASLLLLPLSFSFFHSLFDVFTLSSAHTYIFSDPQSTWFATTRL